MHPSACPTVLAFTATILLAHAATAEDLRCYRPDASGLMPAWSGEVVEDPKQAKQLWTSEERHFGVGWGYGVGPANKNRDIVMSAGFSGPVYADGKVYFSWFLPSGDIVDEQVRAKGKDGRASSWTVDADDLLVCMDAETGKTIWKANMAGKGLNWGYHRKCPWTHAAIVDGRVYWLGSAGRIYCHAAQDGALVWESHTGEGFAELEKMRAKMHAAKSVETWQKGLRIKDGDSTSPINSSPCVVDGVVVVNDSLCDAGVRAISSTGVGVVGLDASSGERLWRLPAAIGIYVSPLPWSQADRELVIVAGPQAIRCLDPKTGTSVWEIEAPMGAGIMPAVSQTHLLIQRHRVRGKLKDIPADAKGMTCYRFVDGKPELLWEKPPGEFSGPYAAPVVTETHGYMLCKRGLTCVELATGAVVATIEKGGDTYIPLQAANGLLLSGTEVFALDPKNFRKLGNLPRGRETFTLAHLNQGRVYLRTRLPGYENKNRANTQPPEPGCIVCIDLRR